MGLVKDKIQNNMLKHPHTAPTKYKLNEVEGCSTTEYQIEQNNEIACYLCVVDSWISNHDHGKRGYHHY